MPAPRRLRHWVRSAVTGRFVTRLFVTRHRDTTFEQTEPYPGMRDAMRSAESHRIHPDR